ncbi:MAG TPA: response regulator transcription factor [Burkholderiales bacterium]|nr:response regulator transcription factor [Burkholderiales bacterium]
MNVVLVTPVRLFAEGLAACLGSHPGISLCGTVSDLSSLRRALEVLQADAALIDVTQGVDLEEVRMLAGERPSLALVALGLHEQRQTVIRCGRAGFAGYVARTASVNELCEALSDVVAGRLACGAEISGGLLRALFRKEPHAALPALDEALTRREEEVLELIGRGLSNKEIARELHLSVATVKHHVHRVLEKLRVVRRAQAMRRVRDMPWILSLPETAWRAGAKET